LLTGKYAGDVTPTGSRRSLNPGLGGRITPQVFPAVAAYLDGLADRMERLPQRREACTELETTP
jgi:hypothetical protein